MAGIDIFNIKPHQVSRDMRGYSVFMYGGWKTGKTTTAVKFPNHMLLAFEKGYSAIPGAMAVPVNSWSEFRKVLSQLKDLKKKRVDAEAKGDNAILNALPNYETIIVDTADIAYDFCSKYICANNDADSISDIGYGKGYGLVEKEFDDCLRQIVQMGYGLVVISHETDKTFTDESGKSYNKIVPTLDKRANNVLARMCDIIMYTRSVADENGSEKVMGFMRGTSRYEAGSRFKYTPDFIELSYNNLVHAIGEALDKQIEEDGAELFTDKRENLHIDTTAELDFDELSKEFSTIIANIPGSADAEGTTDEGKEFATYWAPRVKQIVEKYAGKGAKVSTLNRNQVEQLSLIVSDLNELVKG